MLIINCVGLDFCWFEFEIMEMVVVVDLEIVSKIIVDLCVEGIWIFFDDFGMGQFSLGWLMDFSFDKLKIDCVFVSWIIQDFVVEYIIWVIVVMCEGLGLEVVVEGVEDFVEVLKLKVFGCGMVQGYFYGKVMDCNVVKIFLVEKYIDFIGQFGCN